MADFREQRAAVKFCFLLGKTGTETLEMLKAAYRDDALRKTQVFEWLSRFKSGEMSIIDQPRSGRPSTARTYKNVKKIREIVLADRRRTIKEIVEESGVAWSSVQRIISEDLGMRRVDAKFVPARQELNSRGIHSLHPAAYVVPKRTVKEEASSSVVSTSFLPQGVPSEDIKKKSPQARAHAFEGDECEALSMLWLSELKKLDQAQRVIAEDLINSVLKQAFFEELTSATQIFDGVN